MKNLFILPTDKPSRLYFKNGVYRPDIAIIAVDKYISSAGYKLNIYITSDEEIKDGDWCMSLCDDESYGEIYQCKDVKLVDEDDKKIILTTDENLIKDGVQAIDDEFLEWFVKNPSCEEVEVKYNYVCSNCNEDKNNPKYENCHGNYRTHKIFKIIIPKEEIINCEYCGGDGVYITADSERVECPICEKGKISKEEPNFYEKLVEYFKNTPREKILEDWNKTAECDDIGPTVEEFLGNTEETLEQAAIRLYPDNIIKLGNETSYNAALLKRKDFIDGGNWVKERMYSDEEIIDLLQEMNDWPTIFEGRIDIKEWFKQYKKK